MPSSKREQARTERRLIAALTQTCETAKSEIAGFCWLTHEVDYANFPESLQVIWAFDTVVAKDQALSQGLGQRMIELTAQALEESGITLTTLPGHVHFDSEEQCLRENGGNWELRLSRQYARRG
ncbi:hypothetical protein V2J66_23265 [Pseudomonas alliivorans]|uniref:hypothetical protein n=1 Tax=Pseudomonas TaxID=286 RepID=UPI001AEA5A97|nr:hypothetical protein [Pseudomonas alliivorans]MBP0949497.1 hypothetical protein [Pseudomonas alliivorans]MEE4344549.1 hypothetical protein [Pseudomonas alliivorans]MEE4692282.1 hypothetical protein [Pseudomonas alliivorans]MEE4713372.1 hypothetical protein [Pseudomonas alliivorans]MEE4728078.1 hypothetical protein [Pseudomonas alliivorans]